MGDLPFILAAAAIAGSLALVVRLQGRSWRAAIRDVASRRGARVDAAGAALALEIGGAHVEVAAMPSRVRIEAFYPVAAGPRFVLLPRSLNAWVTAEDAVAHAQGGTGIPQLDDGYVLRTLEADETRAVWSPRSATLLAGTFPEASVFGERESLRIEMPHTHDARRLEAGIDLAAELANTDLFGLNALRALPSAVEATEHGRGCVSVATGGAVVYFQPQAPSAVVERPSTLAWVDLDRGEPFELRLPCDEPAIAEAPFAGTLAPDLLGLFSRLGAGTLAGAVHHVRFHWERIERDRGRLMAAASVLAGLARSPKATPYR